MKLINDKLFLENFIKDELKGGNKNTKYIKKVIDYYNDSKKNIKKILNFSKNNYKYDFITLNNIDIIEIKLNNKIIMKAEYDIIGIYNTDINMFYYGYILDHINKKLIKNSSNIKNLKKQILNDTDQFSKDEIDDLYFYSSNSHFFIEPDKVPFIIKLMMFINSNKWFISIHHPNNNNTKTYNEFLAIRKILT